MAEKAPEAFRTISEVADWLGVSPHVLRFWETKFTQVKPVKRAGGRRYYRPADMELLGGIQKLLHEDGLTVKGAQKVLREQGVRAVCALSRPVDTAPPAGTLPAGPATEDVAAPPPAALQEAPETLPLFSARRLPDSLPDSHTGAGALPEPADASGPAGPADALPVAGEETGPEVAPGPEAATAAVPPAGAEVVQDPGQDMAPPPLPPPLGEADGAATAGQEAAQPGPAATDLPAPDAPDPDLPGPGPEGPETAGFTEAEPEPAQIVALFPGPVIAPLPGSDLPLAARLARLVPGQIPAARLRPIHAGLRALRDRMERQG